MTTQAVDAGQVMGGGRAVDAGQVMDIGQVLNAPALADLAGVSRQYVYEQVRKGSLTTMHGMVKAPFLFTQDEAARFLARSIQACGYPEHVAQSGRHRKEVTIGEARRIVARRLAERRATGRRTAAGQARRRAAAG